MSPGSYSLLKSTIILHYSISKRFFIVDFYIEMKAGHKLLDRKVSSQKIMLN